ncbi:hypothetical protein IGX34_21710 [Dyella sp. 7MK23]|uniref:DUF4136 domain-containing protein n=2 Tax=Dyella acidiphila TaxID=2775866 RepID=A0ABR9GG58_9GAMM|nr:hypothetical protein [Dyella acidiphila]
MLLVLSGCSGTLQTRWAGPDDGYYRWKPQMESMPIEVHGSVQQAGADEVAKQIPAGTTPQLFAVSSHGQGKLATASRIVLYIGAGPTSADERYCETAAVMQGTGTHSDETHLVAALCDGPRLIDVTARDVNNAAVQTEGMASIVKSMKRRLLSGLKVDDGFVAAEYGNG